MTYTPDTAQIKSRWLYEYWQTEHDNDYRDNPHWKREFTEEAFDRWLTEYTRQTKEAAWDEADLRALGPVINRPDRNPYRGNK